MLKNYLQVALRSVFKQKIYSLINIIGLAIGIASCTLIFMHVEDEYSYDSFHTKADQIYKVVLERSYPDHTTNYGIIPHSFSGVMATDYPEVVQSVRIFGNLNNEIVVSYIDDHGEKKQFEESGFVAADSNFFDFFSIPLLQGDAKSVLTEPQGIVVTQQTAYKYFGHDDPIGKSLKTDIGDFTITGVCENVPENSHLEFDFLSSLATFDFFQTENFTGFSAHTYVELVPETNTGQLMAKFPEMVEKYAAPQIEQNLNTSYSEYIAAGNGYQYTLLPLRDIHLEPVEYEAEFKTGGNKTDVIVFISIAVLILFIACINFMNLAIARSTERAKEVGIRKTLGSFRSQLIGQFLAESVLISLIALGVAIGLVYLILPGFNTMVGKQLYLQIGNSLVLPGLLLFSIVVGILAGIYPAFFLSSFNTVSVLKGGARSGKSGNWLRNGLVIVQFTISISLIVGTLIIKQQLDFVNQKNLGFDRENILIIERANVLETQQEAFIKEIKNIQSVKSAGGSGSIPTGQYFGIQFIPQGANEPLTTNAMVIDDEFSKTMNLEIISGEGFSENRNDSLTIIINEQAASLLDTDNPIGMELSNLAGNPPETRKYKIIGVVKNFHYMSLKSEISPFVLLNNESMAGGGGLASAFISVKVEGEVANTVETIKQKWELLVPEEPFKFTFLNDELNTFYQAEMGSGKKLTSFSILAILIACIGLFGLSAYTAGLRIKEIGVRKVMGASSSNIILLLNKDFSKLVLIALIIAAPLSWYSMEKWLENFAYRVSFDPLAILWAGLITFCIAWATVSFQSVKAAIINPVKSLRNE